MHSVGRMHNYQLLKQLVHIVTSGLYTLNWYSKTIHMLTCVLCIRDVSVAVTVEITLTRWKFEIKVWF